MSWIRDVDGDLVNLEHVQSITVTELEHSKDEETHGCWANTPGDNSHTLLLGSEEKCKALRDAIAAKVSIIKPEVK